MNNMSNMNMGSNPMPRRMSLETIRKINSARYFQSNEAYEAPRPRPWQYVQMEYDRVHLAPPASVPAFKTMEDAQIWMCLDSQYNLRMRERDARIAG